MPDNKHPSHPARTPATTPNAPKNEAQIRAEERARLQAILALPESLDRPKLAQRLAIFTNLGPAAVADFMNDLPPEEKPRADVSAFIAAMREEGSTGISSALGTAPTGDAKSQRLAEIREAGVRHSLSRGYISPSEAASRGLQIQGI